MPETNSLLLFMGASLVLLLTPGPAVLFVVTRSLQYGRSAALMSTVGLTCGGLVHVIAAVLGLSAILASSAMAFTTVKLMGAAYLLFLGIKALRSRSSRALLEVDPSAVSLRRQFLDGLVVNIFNPKPAIFFLAFLPQFVDPASGSMRAQLALLGLTFVALAFVTDGLYALAAGSSRSWLSRNQRVLRYEPYFSAAVYFGLGLSAALTGRRND